MSIDLVSLVEPVKAIAQEAGHRILEIYLGGFSVTEKADKSPITEADIVAHNSILQGLNTLAPAIPVLSEEDAEISFAERSRWEWLWLVDPLDGTREFIRRNDQFSVNIALVHRHRAIFGLILIPVTGICYFAYELGGAFKEIPQHTPYSIHTHPIDVNQPIRVTSSRASYTMGKTLQAYLECLGQYDYVGIGSALKSCLVAEGKVDLYPRFGPTYEWDTAAAQVIVEEAGGGVTDTHMRPLRYNARPTLINPDFFVFGDPNHDWSRYLPNRYTAAR
jgi:3'(2'), 5'-bisphosphate nucleotidase